MSASIETISQMPAAATLDGTELVPLVQNGANVQASAAAVSASGFLDGGTIPVSPGTVPLTLTGNVTPGAPPLLSSLGTMLTFVGKDGVNAGVIVNTFGRVPYIGGQRSNGTFAAPTQVIAGNVLFRAGGWGYASAGDGNPAQWIPGFTGLIEFQSSEPWVGNHNGTQISLWTTPNGTLAPIQIAAFSNAGSFVLGGAQTTPTPPGNSPANNVTSAFGIDDQTGLGINTTGPLTIASHPPASSTAAGVAGTIAWDAGFFYVCVSTNTWKRSAISTW